MRFRTLILRSLRFHWRGHLGVLLGAAVGSAALIGALVVGDSVRLSLRDLALQRLGWVDVAMAPSDRFFTQELANRLKSEGDITTGMPAPRGSVSAALKLPGTAARQDGSTRANRINVFGVQSNFWIQDSRHRFASMPDRSVMLNQPLATQLKVQPGDEIVLRVHKPTALSREVPITSQNDASVALRVRVFAIVSAEEMGNFSLQASQTPPLNAFLRINDLNAAAGLDGKANVMLIGGLWIYDVDLLITAAAPTSRWNRIRTAVHLWLSRFGNGGWMKLANAKETVSLSGESLGREIHLADYSLDLRLLSNPGTVELRTDRIFLDHQVVVANLQWTTNGSIRSPEFISAPVIDPASGLPAVNPASTNARPILTYLVNQLRAGDRTVPYSMVTAAGSPWTPPDMKDDEILVNRWLADDMQLKVGDLVELSYFLAESGANLIERTNRFRVRGVVPMTGAHGDRTLMPEFPGLAKAESTHDWDAGFPLVHKIRDQDENYWKQYRGTPKAFVTLSAGQTMWGNRFGNLTAIRFAVPEGGEVAAYRYAIEQGLLSNMNPASLGLRFEPVRAQALAASSQSQDFGGLFIGFSFFLIIAALILMALMFQFGLEQRLTEVGTLLALGFTPKQVRRLFLGEGVAVAFIGGLLGVVGGVGYAKAMLYGLTTLWRDAVGTSALHFHATSTTLMIGLFASVLVCAATIGWVLRKQARRPARELLTEGADVDSQISNLKTPRRSWSRWIAISGGVSALAMIGWAVFTGNSASAETFFSAGALLLVAELAAVAVLLTKLDRSEAGRELSVGAMGLRSCTRRRSRSLASVALLACGSFLVAAVGANRLDAGRDATKRTSGTGGFTLFGESTLPVVRDLNTKSGREFFGLDENAMKGVSVVPFRVRDGDDASCLNLNRAQTPRLLGVNPKLLPPDAFTFSQLLSGAEAKASKWSILSRTSVPDRLMLDSDEVAAIGDAASIQWALGKKLGDTIEFTDERGQKFKVRLVAGVANSILQGNLIIDEAEFTRRFPSESGYRMFLIDTPSNTRADIDKVSANLSRALQDVGLELTPTTQRLAAFNAVQNTYLNTFQVLGGLGLLLGSAGLGVVVLRNVLERRGELGLLQAVGFRRRTLQWLVLSEHAGLLWLGLGVGMTSALAAVLPALLAPGAEVHYVALGVTLAGVLASGLAWTWAATRFALRGELLKTLRNE